MNTRSTVLPLLLALLTGCGLGLHELPDPPAKEAWTKVSLIPGEDQEADEARYLEARAAVLAFYSALANGRHDEAWGLMSVETQSMLSHFAVDGDGKNALASGTLKSAGGSEIEWSPLETFMMPNVKGFEDSLEGEEEHETSARKELFLLGEDGQSKKLVVIREAGKWVIHRTKAPK